MLSENVQIHPALAYAAGTADRTGAVVDLSGAEGVCMLVHFSTIAVGATTSIKAQYGTESDGSDMTDIEGSSVSVADDDDDTLKYIEIHQPRSPYRYCRVYIDKDTSNSTAESAIYLVHRPKEAPVTQPSTVVGERHLSPAAGTA